MDHVSGKTSEKDAKRINRCRIHMQALTVSDITTLDGKEKNRGALRGIMNVSFELVHK